MKLKNILSILCLMFVAVACSMDDEAVLDDIASSKNEVSLEDAYVTFSLASEGLTTKAGEETGDIIPLNYAIKDCSVILYKDNGILAVEDEVKVAANGQLVDSEGGIFSILTKVRKEGMRVMIIANSTIAFKDSQDMDEVNNKLQEDMSFTHDDLVKVGTADITFKAEGENSSFKPTGETGKTETNIYTQSVRVSQLAARIDFQKFLVTFAKGTKEVDVKIKEIRLQNVNHQVKTSGIEVQQKQYQSTTWDCGAGILVYDMNRDEGNRSVSISQNGHLPIFYSFPNTNANEKKQVTLYVKYQVGSDDYEQTYIINRPGKGTGDLVKSGYLYQLQVKMTVTNRDVDLDVVCSVQDWIKHSISGELK